MKIREDFIKKTVLNFYKSLPSDLISLPFDILSSAQHIPRCKTISYQDFAAPRNLPISEMIRYAESEDGATKYHISWNAHIILYNEDRNVARTRFTIAHEIGHVLLGHLPTIAVNKVAKNNLYDIKYPIIEQEADIFASMVLCPFPILRTLGIQTAPEIKNICDLSIQASLIKTEQYIDWIKIHRKTAWENDIKCLFRPFINQYMA